MKVRVCEHAEEVEDFYREKRRGSSFGIIFGCVSMKWTSDHQREREGQEDIVCCAVAAQVHNLMIALKQSNKHLFENEVWSGGVHRLFKYVASSSRILV